MITPFVVFMVLLFTWSALFPEKDVPDPMPANPSTKKNKD